MRKPGKPRAADGNLCAAVARSFICSRGRVPFSGRDPLSKIASHAGEKIPSLDSADVPPDIGSCAGHDDGQGFRRRINIHAKWPKRWAKLLAKLDPDQLQWPASPMPNKLPEFEAWLQPYHVAQDPNYMMTAQDIAMPPILAAGLKTKPVAPTMGQPAELPAQAVKTTPTVTAATAKKPLAVAERVTERGPVRTSAPVHQQPQAIVFPPDDGDFIAMVADRGKRASGRCNRDVVMLVGLLVVAIIVGVVAWFALHKNSGPTAEGGETNPVRQLPAASDDDAKAFNDNLSATGDTVETAVANSDTQPANGASANCAG